MAERERGGLPWCAGGRTRAAHRRLAAPTTHFVTLGQAILFGGAGFDIVWPQFVARALIGTALFAYTLARFRSTIGTLA